MNDEVTATRLEVCAADRTLCRCALSTSSSPATPKGRNIARLTMRSTIAALIRAELMGVVNVGHPVVLEVPPSTARLGARLFYGRLTIQRRRLNATRSSHEIGQCGCELSARAAALVARAPSMRSGDGCL